jgi:chorismate mutase
MSTDQIENLRSQIDTINEQIITLIAKRKKKAKKIGALKRMHDIDAHQPNREKQVLSQCCMQAEKADLDTKKVEAIFEQIIALCRNVQLEDTNGENNRIKTNK